MAKKSVEKSDATTVEHPNLKPFKKGPDPRRGRGPKKGHGGRTPDVVRAIAREAYAKQIPTLERFARKTSLDETVRIKAISELRAASGLTTITPTDSLGDTLTIEALLRMVPPEEEDGEPE